ncbi:helix-turn-helix domain-containing protein [Ligilactobacillus pobuzihii]|uniref:helix-turn-helix domain-containing protein n=1 Tax=Ligilactobacillus pobuzihii TaxID=449659 RepID=UPI003219ED5F
MITVWNKIQRRLDELNMTANELANAIGAKHSSIIYHIKDGSSKKPSFELMCKIADALEVSLDYFREDHLS